MPERLLPRYPIYIPTKGRVDQCLTARCFQRDSVPFHLVVEPQEHDAYAERFGPEHLYTLPFSDQGSVIPARNWIKDHATDSGAERHWQFDDNVRAFRRYYRTRRIPCSAGIALRVAEDFVDRYENVAIAGLNYAMFAYSGTAIPPFYLNIRVYSCSLILNSIPHRWRGTYNEDTDICLQVLADGWCTVLLNAFLAEKMTTMTMKGGNTDALYLYRDGRLKMARALERMWPKVVTTKRRFKRPQHVVKDAWRRFDTPLRKKPGIQIDDMPNEYGMKLKRIKETIRSPEIRGLMDAFNESSGTSASA